MGFLFTSESVSEGHPDKVSDQISDAILDEFLRRDANSKVACETLCTTGLVVVAGEVRSEAYVDVQGVARRVIDRIGYTKSEYQFDCNSCGILSAIHEQSSDINQGVVRAEEDEQGAGDQGIMFGYACNETREMMPATLILSHVILKELAVIRREGEVMTYLRPDSKSQVTIEYDEKTNRPLRVHTIVVSTQHDEFILPGNGLTEKEAEERMQATIREDVRTILIPRVKARLERAGDKLAGLIGEDYILHVNPTGKFVIGGPHGDTGLTGRKIIVDTYGGRGAHGGGAFSGKDSSKVDRSAAYAARHIAKNLVRRYLPFAASRRAGGHDRRRDRPPHRQAFRPASRRHRPPFRPEEPDLRGHGFLRSLRQPSLYGAGEGLGERPRNGTRDRVLRLGEARCRGADSQRVRIVTVRVAENRDVRRGCPDFCSYGHTNRTFPSVCPTNRNKT